MGFNSELKGLNMVTKPANVHKCINASYITKIAVILHGLAILVAILREVHYKRWIYMSS
jgi:hypothetical protein